MLQSMIIDWDVKWPHAGQVTAADQHRQDKGGGNGDVREGHVNMDFYHPK